MPHSGEVLLATLRRRVTAAASPAERDLVASPSVHFLWFCDGLLLFFLVSWFGSSVLKLDNDLYYAVFIWLALTFLYSYVRTTRSDIVQWLRTRWRSSLFFGLLAGVYAVVNVWRTNPTEHPSGLLLVFELFWRGLAYGIADSLVLTAFPLAVAIGVMRSETIVGVARRLVLAGFTLVLIWTMSTVYHRGFAQFDDDDLVEPQLSTAVVSIPTLLTANPVGSVVAQVSLHMAVTFRTFESDVLVPPEVEFIPDYELPGIFGPGDAPGAAGSTSDCTLDITKPEFHLYPRPFSQEKPCHLLL